MRRLRDLASAHKKVSFGLWILVLVAVVAGVQWQLTSGGSKTDTQVLGASVKKPPAVPTISSGPTDPTNSTSATFVFDSNPAPAGYLCKLDAGSFSACASPKVYAGPLSAASHTFQVEAQDSGFTSNPAIRTWAVDIAPPPPPTITQKPDDPSFDTSPQFVYSDGEAGVTFQCQLDTSPAQSCGSSVAYKKLSVGDHIFSAVASDRAGNRSPAATYGWTVVDNKAFAISGNAVGPLSPGVTQGLALRLSNPYNFSIRVGSVDAAVTKATPSSCTLAVANLQVVGLSAPVDIPANSSVTLGSSLAPGASWPAGWPTITMVNSASNQDTCKNATFTLSYSGTATKS